MASAVETLIRSSVFKGIETIAAFNRKRLPKPATPHPFLSGIHTPMSSEVTLKDLAVTGAIPEALNGRYLRIGPSPIVPNSAAYHWFTGDGMVHALRLEKGRALWYRNRWIKSKLVATALNVDPAPGPRTNSFDTVNTNVLEIGGRTFALMEAGSFPVEISETLDVQAYNPFDGTLTGSFTAHPHQDPLTGEQHAICYEGVQPDQIRHVVINAAGQVVRELPIAVKNGPSIHDCAITSRYAIIMDLPVTFSMKALLGGHSFPYRWNSGHQARVGLLPRAGGEEDVIWCQVDPAYVFHVANGYDVPGGEVIMDVCAYATMFEDGAQGPDGRPRGLERWTIDPVTRKVAVTTLDSSRQEFPRIDPRRFGQTYRFLYTLALPPDQDRQLLHATILYKHDLETGERETYDFGEGKVPGEFVFVPSSAGSAEDEGWLMGLVIDVEGDTTDLVILDASNFKSGPVARVHIPHRVPPGFHGNWLGES